MTRRVYAIALNTFREAIRNKILYSVLFFAGLLIGVSAFFGAVTIGSQSQVIKDFGLTLTLFFGVVTTIIVGVSLLHKELARRTIFNVLSKPVTRWEFIVGKYLGLLATVSTLSVLMGGALVIFAGFFDRQVDWLLLYGVAAVVLELFVISAVVIFFSTITVTTTLAGLFTLGTFVAGHSIAYLRKFVAESGYVTDQTAAIFRLVDTVLPNLSLFNLNSMLIYGHVPTPNQMMMMAVYAVSYAAVALCLASLCFSRREFIK